MTTTRKPGNDTGNGTSSWGTILAAFGVPESSSAPPPPPSRPSLPPPRATIQSIAPTAFDVEPAPQAAAQTPDAGDVPEFRGTGRRGMTVMGALAVATLAFAAVWTHTSGGAMSAAAGAAIDTGIAGAAAHAAPKMEMAPFVPTIPQHAFREIIKEEEGMRIANHDPMPRYNGALDLRTLTRAREQGARRPAAERTSVAPASAPASDPVDAPQVGYETTVIGEFAGKI